MENKDFGFLTGSVRKLVSIFGEFPSRIFIRRRVRRDASDSPEWRSITVDIYICACILVEIACLFLGAEFRNLGWILTLIAAVCVMRISEIVFTSLDIAIFSSDRLPVVASATRTVTLTLINYVELWLCFSGIYGAYPGVLRFTNSCNQPGVWDAMYFSGTTQLTIGYGDIVPIALGRTVALVQGFLGFIFALLILSKLVGLVPSLHSIIQTQEQQTPPKVNPQKRES